MAKTKSQIGVLALQMLKSVDGDATPDSNDTTVIEDAYDEIYAMLQTKHLVTWASSGSVPDESVMPVAYLVAEARLPLFTPPQANVSMIMAGAARAIGDLIEVQSLDYVPQDIQSEPL